MFKSRPNTGKSGRGREERGGGGRRGRGKGSDGGRATREKQKPD